MGSSLLVALITLLQQSLHWALFLAGRLGTLLLWLFWPIWLLALALGWLFTSAQSAQAGWFSWLWGDSDRAAQQAAQQTIERLESANRALQTAAEVVNEASKHQADQNVEVLSAIQVLSNERTELAGSLERIAELAAQDSQWAAAMNLAAPVLLAVSVLLVASLALWITHRGQSSDDGVAVLDVLLVEELMNDTDRRPHSQIAIEPLMAGSSARTPQRRLPGRVKNIYEPHDPKKEV